MKKWLAKFVLFITGWKIINNIGEFPKSCIIVTVPHTSWFDAVIATACIFMYDLNPKTLTKRELFKFPLTPFLKLFGAIPVDRFDPNAHKNREDVMKEAIDLLNSEKGGHIGIAPEGTRGKATQWKSGFYRLSKATNAPMVLATIDNVNKVGTFQKIVHPSDDQTADMKAMMKVFASIPIKDPDTFSLDTRYID